MTKLWWCSQSGRSLYTCIFSLCFFQLDKICVYSFHRLTFCGFSGEVLTKWKWKSSYIYTSLIIPLFLIIRIYYHCYIGLIITYIGPIDMPVMKKRVLWPIPFAGFIHSYLIFSISYIGHITFYYTGVVTLFYKLQNCIFEKEIWVLDVRFVYNAVQCKFCFSMASLQWNLSVTTTSIIKYITCDLFSNVF